MERYTDDVLQDACRVQGAVSGMLWPQSGKAGSLLVPPLFTSFLLMSRAGMPVDVIAYVTHVEPRRVRRGIRLASALLIWRPYAARVDEMLNQIPRYTAGRAVPAWRQKEGRCAARLG